MDEDTKKCLDEQSVKLDAIYQSVEKTRKYFFWTLMISITVIILPLIGLLFAIPSFLSTYSSLGM